LGNQARLPKSQIANRKSPMKVLLLTTLFPNRARPTQAVFTEHRARALAEHAEVQVMAPVGAFPGMGWRGRGRALADLSTREERPPLTVWHPRFFAPPGVGRDLRAWAYARGVCRAVEQVRVDFPFDVLNAHFAYPDGVAGAWLARRCDVPLVVSVLGSDVNVHARHTLQRVQIRWALRSAARVVAVSEALRREVVALGVPEERTAVVPTGVDVEVFHPQSREAARQALQLPAAARLVLYIGNLLPVKGVPTLITAFAEVARQDPTAHLVLVGHGPLRGRLEQQVHAADLHRRVTFAGARPHADIPQWLAAADVLCLPSVAEGLPNVVLEALACGRPVVASAVGGVPELVTDEAVGRLVPPGDAAALAAALRGSLSQTWDAAALAGRVRDRSWAEVGRRDAEVLRAAIRGNKGERGE
jgi:glycosyltransferase involved in cell wall biosynthesis